MRGEDVSRAASAEACEYGVTLHRSSLWCTTSVGTAILSTGIAGTGRPRGSTRIVDVSTRPSAPIDASARYATDCVPRLVPTSQTGSLVSARSHSTTAAASAA